jgi:hypothetical protein
MDRILRNAVCTAATIVAISLAGPVTAAGFRYGELEAFLGMTASYGLLYRVEDPDRDLIAIASGGNARTADLDDGNLNYDTGIVSNMVQFSAETLVSWRTFGFFGRAVAFYDYENEDRDRARTNFNGQQKKLIGSDIDLRESYLSANWTPGGMPITMRVGQQVINWSETTFVREGLDLINPIDTVAAFQPTAELRDLRTPQRMVWGAANVTEIFAVEAFYQYEWEPLVLPPVGGFFSALDLAGGAGLNKTVFGGGEISDLGTDLDSRFALPEGTLGFDDAFQHMPGVLREEPDDGGQYGAALLAILPVRNAIKAGLHYVRYHSRLPVFSGITADPAAVLATSNAAVDARAAPLTAIYEAEGIESEEAQRLGRAAAEDLTLSGYVNEAGYLVTYPEDIDAFALSFNTSTTRTGSLFAMEISHHRDYPFQVAIGPVLNATRSPVLFDPSIGDTVLGEFGPSEVVPGVVRLDRSQASVEMAQIFRGRFAADQVLLKINVGWSGVHDLPSASTLPLTSHDANSWGYGVLIAAQYSGVFGGLNLTPRLGFTHDVDGTTPAPVATFVEDRKSLRLGLGASFINRVTADLSYVSFFHGGQRNTLRDRDYVGFRITLSL